MFFPIITFVIAVSISAVSGYFSVFGLAHLFAATFVPVAIMGCVLELGKIVSALWLHRHWNSSPKPLKWYLTSAVAVLMFVSAIGVFGFLSKGHMEQQIPLQQIESNINSIDRQISQKENELENFESRREQLEEAFNTYLEYDYVTRGIDETEEERNEVRENITRLNNEISELRERKSSLQQQLSEATQDIGPIMYVMDILNVEQTQDAVIVIILIIMFVFDPVAISLFIGAQHSVLVGKNKTLLEKSNNEKQKLYSYLNNELEKIKKEFENTTQTDYTKIDDIKNQISDELSQNFDNKINDMFNSIRNDLDKAIENQKESLSDELNEKIDSLMNYTTNLKKDNRKNNIKNNNENEWLEK